LIVCASRNVRFPMPRHCGNRARHKDDSAAWTRRGSLPLRQALDLNDPLQRGFAL
jgi:hypothetical protein